MSLKRKTSPGDEEGPRTLSAPSSIGGPSRPASSNGDAQSPVPIVHKASSTASGGASSAASPHSQSHSHPSANGTASTTNGTHAHKRSTASPTGPRVPSPPTIVVPEALRVQMQHAAFPMDINLIPAANSIPHKPGRPRTAERTASSGNLKAGPGSGSVSGPGSLALGQILRTTAPAVPGPGTARSSPLNRAAVVAAAERSGVRALNGLPCINALWHIGTMTWGGAIPIHGIMDGYSQRLLALRAGESCHPKVVAALFRNTVKAIGCCPARVRAEEGEYVAWVKERMRGMRGKRAGWFIHGPPESNQQLAPIWDMVAVHPTISALSAKLDKHTRDGVYDKTCPLDLLAAQVAYLPQLNVALDQIRKEWNRRPIDVCGLSKDGAWSWNIQEWSKRGKHPATEPEGIELPREALGHHSAEEFVNYGATGGPYVPCSVHTNRPSSENGESDYRPALKTVTSQLASAAAPAPSPPAHPTLLSQAPLEDIGDIDPCLRLWLEDFPLPKSLGYAGVRAAMGEYIADDFAHVAPRFRVSRDRSGI